MSKKTRGKKTAKNKLNPVEARLKIFETMTPPTQKIAKEFEDKDRLGNTSIILYQYDKGVKLLAMQKAPDKYGENSIRQLSEYLGRTDTELGLLMGVAKAYSRDEVKGMTTRQMTDGNRISWRHLTAMLKVAVAKTRRELWGRVFAESIGANQLEVEINSSGVPKKNIRSGGRKPGLPSSPLVGVHQIEKTAAGINNRFDGWQEAVLDKFDEIAPDDVTPIMLDKARLALTQIETLEGNVTNLRERLTNNVTRLESINAANIERSQQVAEQGEPAEAETPEAAVEETPRRRIQRSGRRPAVAAATI